MLEIIRDWTVGNPMSSLVEMIQSKPLSVQRCDLMIFFFLDTYGLFGAEIELWYLSLVIYKNSFSRLTTCLVYV